ncbi:hypothetical protein [Williamsoniiplasma somnilux]|uniref:hypothetical protein n=1 Tax=Williamsoniiplasma somnilux TaxID=215578 RepID=UPI00146FB892|nr:hypothetical protein [Williamsoniiplasma somnilux]
MIWKNFFVIAFLPKTTFQVYLVTIPLATIGFDSYAANVILIVVILSIIICAPIGSITIDLTKNKLIIKNS